MVDRVVFVFTGIHKKHQERVVIGVYPTMEKAKRALDKEDAALYWASARKLEIEIHTMDEYE